MVRPADQRWAARFVATNPDRSQDELVRFVAARVCGQWADANVAAPDEPPGGWSNPWLVGLVHEQGASFDERRKRGAWYTPRPVVDAIVRQAFDAMAPVLPRRLLDPTCGGGAFVLAALDEFVRRGLSPTEALGRVRGSDSDPGAVAAARLSVSAWATLHNTTSNVCSDDNPTIVRLDALLGCAYGEPPDLVVGNPPFASPLKAGAMPETARAYRGANDADLGPYADLASLHLHRALNLVGPGGFVSLVLPQSTLSSRDVSRLRERCDTTSAMRAVWATNDFVFDAGVRVWAPTFEVGGVQASVMVSAGRIPAVVGERRYDSWRGIVADALGAPPVMLDRSTRVLGSMVSATAGFRDEYYGLAAACGEESASAATTRLVTVGAIDPLVCWWGTKPTRFASTVWDRPVIDRTKLDDKVARWANDQLRPKVVLATQTKVLEPYVDRTGTIAPSTPLIAVHADVDELSLVAAVLLAPPVVGWLYRRCFGSALSGDAIKVSASQLLDVPLPVDGNRWVEAAALVDQAEGSTPAEVHALVEDIARLMTDAYGCDDEVFVWWRQRLAGPPAAADAGAPATTNE